jgi:hypothetical protein
MARTFKYIGYETECFPPMHFWEVYENKEKIGVRFSPTLDSCEEAHARKESAKNKLEALGITKEELKSLMTELW